MDTVQTGQLIAACQLDVFFLGVAVGSLASI
jgi:hypothetical protein